jgi:ribose/xylose/arabinose/galactoside ABC-type transport system permease subunit
MVARSRARQIIGHENSTLLFVLLGLIFGIGAMSGGLSLGRLNTSNVLMQSSIKGVAAIGQAVVILTGGIDASVGGIGLFSSVLGAALISTKWESIIGHPISLSLALPIMVLAGLGWGAINGTFVSKVGIPALIATLGFWQISTGAAFEIVKGNTIGGIPDAMSWWGQGMVGPVPVPVIVFVLVAVVVYFILNYTGYGRAVYATGGNPVSAWLSGINVNRVLFSVYPIAGFLAGIAAIMQLGRIESAAMTSLSGLEIDSITAAAIGGVSLMGGRGNIIGVVLGTLIVGVISNGLSVMKAGPATLRIAKGAILIIAVAIDCLRRRRGTKTV